MLRYVLPNGSFLQKFWMLLFFLVSLLGIASGCSREAPVPEPASEDTVERASADAVDQTGSQFASTESSSSLRVVFLGDSLTAGLSLNAEQAFPFLVGKRLQEAGYDVEAINAGVSGDTSAGGLRRLPWLLKQNPALVVLELGANDGLRGLSLEATESNLRQIIEQVQARGAKVLLLGMMIPPNYGPEYSSAFAGLFPSLAEELELPLMPFVLDKVAAQPELNLPDGIHPNAAGHEIIAGNLLPYVEPLVRELASGDKGAEGS